MDADKLHHVTVRMTRGYQFVAEFTGLPGHPSIQFDEPPPLGEEKSPSAAAVLGAAVGNCLAASFAFCLRKARLEPTALSAHVTTRVVRNEKGRHRIAGIDVEICPEFHADDAPHLDRCHELFEDFCTVTASVRQGIPVHVTLERPARRGPEEVSSRK